MFGMRGSTAVILMACFLMAAGLGEAAPGDTCKIPSGKLIDAPVPSDAEAQSFLGDLGGFLGNGLGELANDFFGFGRKLLQAAGAPCCPQSTTKATDTLESLAKTSGVPPKDFAVYTGLKAPVQAGQKYQSFCSRVKVFAAKKLKAAKSTAAPVTAAPAAAAGP